MTQTATKPSYDYHDYHDYHRFMVYHWRGYQDAINGRPKSKHFDLIHERSYLAGWEMAQLTLQ